MWEEDAFDIENYFLDVETHEGALRYADQHGRMEHCYRRCLTQRL